jgi:hypothetical protein
MGMVTVTDNLLQENETIRRPPPAPTCDACVSHIEESTVPYYSLLTLWFTEHLQDYASHDTIITPLLFRSW